MTVGNIFSISLPIPERVKIDLIADQDLNDFDKKIALLNHLKFSVDRIHHNTLLINQIPKILILFEITINYHDFIKKLFTLKLNQSTHQQIVAEVINLLTDLIIPEKSLYSHKNLCKLLINLQQENFSFIEVNETIFAKIIN